MQVQVDGQGKIDKIGKKNSKEDLSTNRYYSNIDNRCSSFESEVSRSSGRQDEFDISQDVYMSTSDHEYDSEEDFCDLEEIESSWYDEVVGHRSSSPPVVCLSQSILPAQFEPVTDE